MKIEGKPFILYLLALVLLFSVVMPVIHLNLYQTSAESIPSESDQSQNNDREKEPELTEDKSSPAISPGQAPEPPAPQGKNYGIDIPAALLALYNSKLFPFHTLSKGQPIERSSIRVLGYAAIDYEGDDRSYQSISGGHYALDAVSTFSYFVDENGNLHGSAPEKELKLIDQKGLKALALIHNFRNGGFDRKLAASLLGSPKARAKLIENLLSELHSHSFSGVNVDIENIPLEQRENYVLFLSELKEALSSKGYTLVASVPAKTHDDPNSSWSGAFDYRAVGQVADLVQLMTYDEHWIGGEPGPIASIGWVEEVLKYAVQNIPSHKILLGIAAYGYRWSGNGTYGVISARDMQRLLQTRGDQFLWDPESQTPFYEYTDQDQVKHVIWFENARSVAFKLDLVKEYSIAGVALWRLGFEEPLLWKIIDEKIR